MFLSKNTIMTGTFKLCQGPPVMDEEFAKELHVEPRAAGAEPDSHRPA